MKERNKIVKKAVYKDPLGFIPQDQIDFHNFGEMTPFDIEKYLSEFLEDCYVAKYHQVLVITGKGSVVRPLVQKLLKQNKYVANFKPAGYFNGQGGAFEVELKL